MLLIRTLTAFYVTPVNFYKLVTIRSTVLVKKAQRMCDFVHNISVPAGDASFCISNWNGLMTTDTPNIWGAPKEKWRIIL